MEFASRRKGLAAYALSVPFFSLAAGLLGAPGCRRGEPPRAIAPRDAGAVAPTAFALGGRVTDEVDRAIPEAHVVLLGPLVDAGARGRRETRSDLAGRFAFEGLPRGRYDLIVEAAGLAPIEPAPIDVPGAAPVVRLSGQGRTLPGTLTASSVPLAGARVRLAVDDSTVARETVSDDAGHFVFHGLGAGPYSLRATKGHLTSPVRRYPALEPAPVAIELQPGLGIDGVVVDETGRPLAGASVRAEAAPDDPLAETATSAADGRFRLGPLPPGRFGVVARAPKHLLRAPAAVTLATGAALPAQRLELVRAASAEGRVSDVRGASIAGALIRYGGGGAAPTDLAVIFEPLPLAAEAAVLEGRARGGGAARVARSDANGEFRLEDLLPGPIHLAITRPPYAPLETETTSVAPGEHRILGVLTLGDPAPGGGDGGAAAAPAPPPVARATLMGTAHDSAGRPLARARLRAWPLEGLGPVVAAAPRAPAVASAVTDAGGHFTLPRVPAAPLLLELDLAPYPPTLASTTPELPVDVVVPVPGGVDGEVREHVTGAAVARGKIEGLGPAGERLQSAVKKNGSFRLARLRPGHWTLTASAPGFRSTVRDVDVPESPILGETSVRGLRLELDAER